MKRLAIVIPVYNEEANISNVVQEWCAAARQAGWEYQMLVIDDGSKDRTTEIVRQAGGDCVQLFTKTNSGHGRTCRYGYERALESGAEWILQVDSDGQCDPRYFGAFSEVVENHDCVFGFRTIRQDGLMRWLISRMCSILTALRTCRWLGDANVPYRLMRATALRSALERVPADFDMQNVALTLALKRDRTLRWKWIPIVFRPRQGGENSINLQKIVRMGVAMLRDISSVR
jgi:glycosyltransferase involved in cell wall biosynthesis